MKRISKKILQTAAALVLTAAVSLQPAAALAAAAGASTNAGFSSSSEQHTPAYPKAPASLISQSAILMDEDSGAILYDKNMDEIHYPASITKIMTCMVVLEHLKSGDMDDVITFSEDSINKTEGSGIARQIGEKLTVRQCLYAMMLESANECAYALAEYTGGGDYQKFIRMMNRKAKELGCTNTHFNNCNGLPDTKHYTTAHDMALIARAAYKNKTFRKLISTKTYTIPKTNKNKQKLVMFNHHAMISNNRTSRYLYENAVGGKTGYTIAAWNTLVTYARKDGHTYLTVVLKSTAAGEYTDTRALFDYAFENFDSTAIGDQGKRLTTAYLTQGLQLAEGEKAVSASVDKDAAVTLPSGASAADLTTSVLYHADSSGKQTGTLTWYYAGHKAGSSVITVKTKGSGSASSSAGNPAAASGTQQDDTSSSESGSTSENRAAENTDAASAPAETSRTTDSSGSAGAASGTAGGVLGGLNRLNARLGRINLQQKVIGIPLYVFVIIALAVVVLIIRIAYVRVTRKRKRHGHKKET